MPDLPAHLPSNAVLQPIVIPCGSATFASCFVKANENEALDASERLRIAAYYGRLYRGFEWEYSRSQEGLIVFRGERGATRVSPVHAAECSQSVEPNVRFWPKAALTR